MHKVVQQKPGMSDFSCSRPSVAENEHVESFKSTDFGFSKRVSSPETSNLGPNSYSSFKVSVDDLEVNSPSSVVSSLRQEQQYRTNKIQEEEEGDDDEVMSSYIIEINAGDKEQTDKIGVAEAIEWAKGKLQSQNLLEDWGIRQPEKKVSAEMPGNVTNCLANVLINIILKFYMRLLTMSMYLFMHSQKRLLCFS